MKAVTELTASTFQRKKREGKLPWTKLFNESVQVLMNPSQTYLKFAVQPN